jgi:DUF1365 family protein
LGEHSPVADRPLLAATFSGRRRALATAELLRAFVVLPLVTIKVVAAIHREALRLWFKGARFIPRLRVAVAKEPNTSLASGKSRAYIDHSANRPRGRALVR